MKRLLIVSSWGLSISVLGVFASVLMAYPWASLIFRYRYGRPALNCSMC